MQSKITIIIGVNAENEKWKWLNVGDFTTFSLCQDEV